MTQKLPFILLLTLIFVVIDLYVWQAFRTVSQNQPTTVTRTIGVLFWSLTTLSLFAFFYFHFAPYEWLNDRVRNFIISALFVNYFSKIFILLFLLIDDLRRMALWIFEKAKLYFNSPGSTASGTSEGITRSEFLARTGLIIGAIPVATMGYGIISGAHDYRVVRKKIVLPNLPKSFHGIKIAQISDIHSGSFYNKRAVQGGIDMLLKEKADIIFFTGDLVNNRADEMAEYVNVFDKVKAPLGVFSTLGNHDYGNYVRWQSEKAKEQNLENLVDIHKGMGWRILKNESTLIKQSDDYLAIIGVENWGSSDWQPKYGDIDKAKKGTEEASVKLLLSHDPSHWDAVVRPHHQDIDITFSGHTHGMQFGIEIGNIKWSPVQYFYDQWAGLYQKSHQYIYVNRGYGFIGFPGRIGMPPEITVIELLSA